MIHSMVSMMIHIPKQTSGRHDMILQYVYLVVFI